MFEIEDVGMVLSLDVGKSAHHGHGLTPAGKRVFDKPLPSEPRLRAVFDKLSDKFGTILVIVDQSVSMGARPLAVAGVPAARSPTCPDSRGAGSPTSTRARRRPTRRTPR